MPHDEEQQRQVAPDAVDVPIDKVDPADVEAVESETSNDVVTEHRFPFQKEFIDEVTGKLHLQDRTELIDNGKSVPPPDGPQVRVSFPRNEFWVEAVGSSKLEEKLAGLLKKSIQVLDSSELRDFFYETRCNLVFSFGSNGSHFIDPDMHVLAVTYLCIALSEVAHGKMDRVRYHAAKHRQWTFNWDNQFALTFDSCQPSRKGGTGSEMLESFREQYKEAQRAREEIDAKRDEWLHSTAEPLLDEMKEQLLDSDLPESVRAEVAELREQLRKDAYGYSGLIETQDLEELLDVGDRRARDLSKKGELGVAFSRTYVHSKKEAEHFAEKDRRPGPKRKHK